MTGRALLRPAGALGAAVLIGLLVFAVFRTISPLTSADLRARDLVHALFYPAASPRDDIVIVQIDELTITQLPYRSPIDRGFLAELIASLRAHDPKAIGIDLLIDQPTEEAKDFAFLDAVEAEEGAPVVLVVADRERDGLLESQEAFLAAATEYALVGQAALHRDPLDFVTRAAPSTEVVLGRETPSFAVAMARAGGVDAPDDGFDIAFSPPLPGEDFALRLSAAVHRFFEPEAIRDRYVFVGVNLVGIDRHVTPLQSITDEASRPGVESHAHALAQILDGRELVETPLYMDLVLTLVASTLTALALLTPVNVVLRVGLGFLVFTLSAAVPVAAMAYASVKGPLVGPLTASLLTGGGLAVYRWRRDAATRRRLRQAFGRYVSPTVVKEIESNQDALALGGERREITCVFTDVAGFTGLCEALPGDELVELLNRYLGGASHIFVDHGGTIDKFVGDAIVGFFGAPMAREDHAAAAIRMAVALDNFAVGFAAMIGVEGRHFGVTRIGVHTGEATVGNFGGDVFFDYTAMGDTVNVAARLEGANKAYGGRLTISGDALVAAGGRVEGVLTRPIGRLRVKGREEPLLTHEAFAADDPRAIGLSDYLSAYTAMEAGGGAHAFAEIAPLYPDDPLIAFHAARVIDDHGGDVVTLKEK